MDWTYILVLIGMGIVMFAQNRVQSTFNKYDQLETEKELQESKQQSISCKQPEYLM